MTNSRCAFMYYLVKSFSDDIINLMNYDIEEVVFMYFDKFLDLLKLAFRQKAAVYDAVEFFKNFFLNGFSIKKDFCWIHGRYRTARLSCV